MNLVKNTLKIMLIISYFVVSEIIVFSSREKEPKRAKKAIFLKEKRADALFPLFPKTVRFMCLKCALSHLKTKSFL